METPQDLEDPIQPEKPNHEHIRLRNEIESGQSLTPETFERFARTGVEANLATLNLFDPVANPYNQLIGLAANNLATFIGIRGDATGGAGIRYCDEERRKLEEKYTSLASMVGMDSEEIKRQATLPPEEQEVVMKGILPDFRAANNWKALRQVLTHQALASQEQ